MTSGECFENKWFYMKYIGIILVWKDFPPVTIYHKFMNLT